MVDVFTNDLIDEKSLESRLQFLHQHVARPIPQQPFDDCTPALIPFHDSDYGAAQTKGGGIIVGSAKHAADIPLLKSMNVIAVLNCASGGIARLPVDELKECGIRYAFTNVRQDSYTYPILHSRDTRRHSRQISEVNDDALGGNLVCSDHLAVSNALFADIRRQYYHADETGSSKLQCGNVLFFCVAGQNRSAALATATLMLHGKPLEEIVPHFARQRPFVLENVGFQRQIVELEAILIKLNARDFSVRELAQLQFKTHWQQMQYAIEISEYKRVRMMEVGIDDQLSSITDRPTLLSDVGRKRTKSEYDLLLGTKVEIELLIPGLCTIEARIPVKSSIKNVKKCLVYHANQNLLLYGDDPAKVAKSWLVLAMFGFDDMFDIPLEVEAVELKVQLERMKSMFGLTYEWKDGEPWVHWNPKCRFALVIFSVVRLPRSKSLSFPNGNSDVMDIDTDKDIDQMAWANDTDESLRSDQVPWTFQHEERPGAPATLLENTLKSTHLRAWDFVTGQSFASKLPIVFSFSDDPRDKRAFMMVSRSANAPQQFNAPGEGDILGMGANAIVHRVQLSSTQADGGHRDGGWTPVNVGLSCPNGLSDDYSTGSQDVNKADEMEGSQLTEWDAAVKRPFSLAKMIVFLQNSSEAGLAKRLRFANMLNSDRRVLYFYGLGLGLSTNAYNQNQFKFELMLLAEYEESFSTYTMRQFMEDYMMNALSIEDEGQRKSIQKLQSNFSLTSLKVLLVSLLNAFRDLTLMGVQAFDFNHLNNVLVSRDHRTVRLIDIDGNSQGSIDYPVIESSASNTESPRLPHKPSLDVDLNILLPSVIEQLILGKGRGRSFVSNTRSEIWRATDDRAKKMIQDVLLENFYPCVKEGSDDELASRAFRHTSKVSEWFYAMMKKNPPWNNWTNDIYDAMRCIDHLPIR
ncbi:hypothetical protein HJC23_002467 [Cyclotella cryptica]|uniref:Tyrosine specific protein phosphatases domain-containing protein n=1 Tax=Cyclotella cryptica TaxID=29204 RepID=A0ABD3NFG9_9STRA|eukprot:CCRYP_021117-RA/>CCRYP_021117-RA protein AED:0.29 eAED:0.29 QI:0/0.66/0.57/1/1/1/7/22/917